MTFKKDDPQSKEWASQGGKTQAKNRERLESFIVEGGAEAYRAKMERLNQGETITEPEEQFMDRTERLLPYRFSKLSSKDIDITSKGEAITGFKIIDAEDTN